MNVIVANEQQEQLSNLDIDIIKNITGVYDVSEIVEMFKNFFYSKMILDVTALKDYSDFRIYEKLIHGLEADKIIFLLPEGSKLCTSNFLARLITFGIYNFTTNINGVNYLLKKANTLKDVENILKMANINQTNESSDSANDTNQDSSETQSYVDGVSNRTVENKTRNGTANRGFTNAVNKNVSAVIGLKNVTASAGATTLTYMLLKELSSVFGKDNVVAIEIDKGDFALFNDKRMISIKQIELKSVLSKYSSKSIILIDLNNVSDTTFCSDVLYLVEPSTIKLNKLVMRNRAIFTKLTNKKVVLNKSLLLNNDVFDFENEAGIKVFYNIPPLDERKRNAIINDFLSKLGIVNSGSNNGSGKIFGLFRR